MDTRTLVAIGALTLALVGGVGGYVLMSGSDDAPDAEAVADGEAPPKKGGKAGKAGNGGPATVTSGDPDQPGGGPLKVAPDAPKDPEYEKAAAEARARREASSAEWRTTSTTQAQQWLATNVQDEAKVAQAMGAINKMHDTVSQSRRDMEDGVIHPRVLREEMEMAKADVRVELENILGPEQATALIDHLATSKLGGI